MSVIVPAGSKRREWVPEDPMTRTASAEGAEVVEKDELLEAAMGVLDRQAKEEEVVVEVPAEAPAAVLEEVSDDGVVTEKEEEEVEVAVEDQVKDAVETIEVALEEVKEAVGVQEEVHEEVGVGDESAVDEVTFTEEVVEDSVEAEEEPVVASSEEEFCRFAKISPQNRAKVADYWKNSLGYPPDYVDLLTKDYEK